MNILTDALPDAVLIDGQEVALDTDFRAAVRVIRAFEDEALANVEKVALLVDNLYPEPPTNWTAAYEQGVRYLNGGEMPDDKAPGPRLYSFEQDAPYIYAAFRQTHGIDLATVEHLHWWAFLALFMDLGSETAFCTLVRFRKRLKSGKLTEEEQRAYLEMKDVVDLAEPDRRTDDEKAREEEFMRLVKEGKQRRAQKAQAPAGS